MVYIKLLLVGLALAVTDAAMRDLYTKWHKGEGTYYGAGGDGGGQCTLRGPEPPVRSNKKIKHTIAINNDHWYGSAACGMCFKVKGSGTGSGNTPITGEFLTYANNRCPECHAGDVDLAASGDGRWDIEIQAVQCPVGTEKISYLFQGSNEWYLKVQTRNERVPVTKLELYQNGKWTPMKRADDNFWLFDYAYQWKTPLKAPYKVRLTSDVTGQSIEDEISKLANGEAIQGKVQFKADASLPSA